MGSCEVNEPWRKEKVGEEAERAIREIWSWVTLSEFYVCMRETAKTNLQLIVLLKKKKKSDTKQNQVPNTKQILVILITKQVVNCELWLIRTFDFHSHYFFHHQCPITSQFIKFCGINFVCIELLQFFLPAIFAYCHIKT